MKFQLLQAAILLLGSLISQLTWADNNVQVPEWSPLALGDFTHSQQVLNSYWVFWKFSGDKKDITIAVISQTVGWLGFGLSENAGMKGASIYTLALPETSSDPTSPLVFQERFTLQPGYPAPVLGSASTFISYNQSSEATGFIFKRRVTLTSCRPRELDIKMDGLFNTVIYAWGTSNIFSYHLPGNRGASQIHFDPIGNEPDLPNPGEVLQRVNVTVPNHLVSPNQTTYCYFHQTLESLSDKKLVTGFEVILTSPLVHHIILWACPKGVSQQQRTQDGLCGINIETYCNQFTVGWAVGGKPVIYPSNAGQPINTPASRYFLLEVHYNNNQGVSGVVDNSGLSLTYTEPTSSFRTRTLNVLALGVPTEELVIDFGKAAATVTNECPVPCTNRLNPGVEVWSNLFHMHMRGSFAYTLIVRRGKELPLPLAEIRHFDFSSQNIVSPYRSKTFIYPGDRLITTCGYNTLADSAPVHGGQSTLNEMCFNFISYLTLEREAEEESENSRPPLPVEDPSNFPNFCLDVTPQQATTTRNENAVPNVTYVAICSFTNSTTNGTSTDPLDDVEWNAYKKRYRESGFIPYISTEECLVQ